MASDQNRWFGTGHLGRDPEGTKGDAGKKSVTRFSIAVNRSYSVDGEVKESVTWINCVAFDRVADFCYQYLKKGQFVVVQGEIQVRKYTGRDGTDKTVTEIVVKEITAPSGGRPREDATDQGTSKPADNFPPSYGGPEPQHTRLPDKPPDTRTQDELFDGLGRPIIDDSDIPFASDLFGEDECPINYALSAADFSTSKNFIGIHRWLINTWASVRDALKQMCRLIIKRDIKTSAFMNDFENKKLIVG